MKLKVVQVAYQSGDARAAALLHSAQFGSGPFFLSEHIPLASVTYQASPAILDHSSAYGQWGEVMVELVAYHDVRPAGLANELHVGRVGIHHVACFASDLLGAETDLAAAGHPMVVEAETMSGLRFAFHGGGDLGHLIELYEPTSRLSDFYAQVRAAAKGWDGADVIRGLPLRSA